MSHEFADGYEIEIDSGTPIDVGDVQTYTDEDLSPSTQYSYRVRAYYEGSPREYTEWSETVQATTDSETLTTIPRSFVITADIKLRDEAPEVEAPPLSKLTYLVTTRTQPTSETDSVFLFSLKADQLNLIHSQPVPNGDSPNDAEFSKDGQFLFVATAGTTAGVENIHVFPVTEGVLGEKTYGEDLQPANTVDVSPDGQFVLFTHDADVAGSNEVISVYSHSSGSLTLIDRLDPNPSENNTMRGAVFSPSGDRILAVGSDAVSGDVAYLLSFDGSSLAVLDSVALASPAFGPSWSDDESFGAAGGDGAGSRVFLFSIGESTISISDQDTSGDNKTQSTFSGETLLLNTRRYSYSGGTLTNLGAVLSFNNTQITNHDLYKGFLATSGSDSTDVRVHRFSDGEVTEEDVDTVTVMGSVATSVRWSS